MIGAHLGTMLDQMRADGEDRIANEFEDAALHDYHDMWHDAEFVDGCWFCYNDAVTNGIEWMFRIVPQRKVNEDAAIREP